MKGVEIANRRKQTEPTEEGHRASGPVSTTHGYLACTFWYRHMPMTWSARHFAQLFGP
jgi:hypothetical protein